MKKNLALILGLLLAMAIFTSNAQADDGIVSFNTANLEQLMAIEELEMDEEMAQAIIDYRTANGAFKTVEEMAKIDGMTQDLLEEFNPQETDSGDIVFDPEAEPALAPSKC